MRATSIIIRTAVAAATLTAAVTVVAIGTTATASAQGRTVVGNFCLSEHLFCMSAGLDGQTPVEGYGVSSSAGTCAKPPATTDPPAGPQYCVPSGTGLLALRPGTYWFAVNDDQSKHNFTLRSCPWSTSPCIGSNPANVSETQLTDIATVYTQPVTVKMDLQPGWYRLYCDSDSPVNHENAGMYVDIEVGGAGPVDSNGS
jgi:hypothetical protein